jgi:ABC-2 type transport system ATP-binding protein
MKAIEAYNLTRDYNNLRAVDHINFAIEPGEIFGFLGPNGAGKTTTIKMLTGQLRPTAGGAKVAGWDVVEEREKVKTRIGVVFEYQNVYKHLSARDNLLFTAQLYGIDKDRVDQVLDMVGLANQAKKKVEKYSNGMKQRLLIARAMLPNPEVVFLDEPTKGLDPGMARTIRNIILELAKLGVAIFLTTHYMEEADHLCNRVAILEQGKLIALDTPRQLKVRYGGVGMTLEDAFITLTD